MWAQEAMSPFPGQPWGGGTKKEESIRTPLPNLWASPQDTAELRRAGRGDRIRSLYFSKTCLAAMWGQLYVAGSMGETANSETDLEAIWSPELYSWVGRCPVL